MPRLGIIANPHSKSNKQQPSRIASLREYFGKHSLFEKTNNLKGLRDTIVNFRERDIDILGIDGGDGSISVALNTVVEEYQGRPLPQIAVLGGGTMNVVSAQLSQKNSHKDRCKSLLGIASSEESYKTKKLDSLSVEGRCGFLYTDQSFVRLLNKFYEVKGGKAKALGFCLKVIWSGLLQNPFFKKHVENQVVRVLNGTTEVMNEKTLGIFVATIEKLPLGIPFLPQISNAGGACNLVSINCDAKKVIQRLPFLMLSNRNSSHKEKFVCHGNALEIQYSQKTIYTLDGEIFTAKEKNLSIGTGPKFEFCVL